MQELVNSFDDLPRMMYNMQKTSKKAPQFNSEHNGSLAVDAALREFKPVSCNDPKNQHKIGRMAEQAKRVLQHLSNLPGTQNEYPQPRGIGEVSNIAREKLESFKEKGMPLDKMYSQYDVQRKGTVTYNEFSSSLIAASSGLQKHETDSLAKSLDRNKTGSIEYKSIMSALKQIEDANPRPKQPQPSSTSHESQLNNNYNKYYNSNKDKAQMTFKDTNPSNLPAVNKWKRFVPI